MAAEKREECIYTRKAARAILSRRAPRLARAIRNAACARARARTHTHTHAHARGSVAKYRYAHGDETVPAQWTEGAGSESS